MTHFSKVETACKFIELMATGKDYDLWGPMLKENAVFIKPFHPPGFPSETRGRSEWVSSQRENFAAIRAFHWIDLDLHDTDEPGVVYGTAKSRAELADGRIYENEYVLIVKFEHDLVVEFREYLNPLPVMASFATELPGDNGETSST